MFYFVDAKLRCFLSHSKLFLTFSFKSYGQKTPSWTKQENTPLFLSKSLELSVLIRIFVAEK